MSYRYAMKCVQLVVSILHRTACIPIPLSPPIKPDKLSPLLLEDETEVLYCYCLVNLQIDID